MNKRPVFRKFPSLETERLLLREITQADARWYMRHFSSSEIVHGQGYPAPRGIKGAKEEVKLYFEDLFKNGGGFRWGIELKGEEKLVGSLGYHGWAKPYGHMARMGYDLDPAYWGRGIMTEALVAAIDFGFRRMKLNRIEVTIMPRNKRSIRLVQRLGFKREGLLRQDGFDEHLNPADDVMLSLLSHEWKCRPENR